jgi:hypothetical protein
MTIEFTAVTDKIKAGKPYILKWPLESAAALTETELVFSNVTITSTEPEAVTFSNANGDACQFVGQYSPFEINDGTASEDHNPEIDNIDEILFLGTNATTHSTVLGYSKSPRTLRACRAHFYVPATQGANGVRSINLNFGDGEETTGIKVITDPTPDPTPAGAESWYTIDGRRLDSAPTVKGVYIHNGQKIVVR